MENGWWYPVLGFLGPIVVLTLGWLFGKRKERVELHSMVGDTYKDLIDASKVSVSTVHDLMKSLKEELQETRFDLEKTQKELHGLRKQNRQLIIENQRLSTDVARLKQVIEGKINE